MPDKNQHPGFAPQEHLISIIPAVTASILALAATVTTALIQFPPENPLHCMVLIAYGIAGSVYMVVFYAYFISTSKNKELFAWINAIAGGASLGLLTLILPPQMDILLGVLMIIGVSSSAIVFKRLPAHVLPAIAGAVAFTIRWKQLDSLHEWTTRLGLFICAALAIETIQQLKNLSHRQIKRLEIVNEFSRQITSSLNPQQVMTELNTAIQDALQADTYYVGMVDGDEISLNLFFDNGEYFTDTRVKMEGTLSGWVIENQKELFLPDLRNEVRLPGVKTIIIGKQRTSLSWMGVPMQGEFVKGVIAIASYRPNDFDQSDMELLSNMAQRAALALDNAFRHTLVEEQSHTDSLTGAYNHGYFLKVLEQQAESAQKSGKPLSVIMLDVDYFKQYNDTYGHLAGDEVLTMLCETIRRHIKQADAVGRWGGEEFVISLPNTSGAQAAQVANRIRNSMKLVRVCTQSQDTIPVPTVSQGIAEFPTETNDIIKLIDLADNRLYFAKERGRDQVEPPLSHWERNGI